MFGDRFFGAAFWGNRYFGPPADGNQAIIGVIYTDLDSFGTATVAPGGVSIAAVLFADGDTFGSATLSASYAITGALYSDADSFGAATVAPGVYSITGSIHVDADTFGAAALLSTYHILPDIFRDGDSFGAAIIYTPLIEFLEPGKDRCQRCGFTRSSRDLRKEWTGLMVCEDTCWEPRHPQMSLRGVPDRQNLPWTRPEPEPVFLSPNQVSAADL